VTRKPRDPDASSKRPYGWSPLLALAATQALETGERQALAQAVDGIRAQFGVTDAAIGLLPTAAVAFGVLFAIPMGIAADRRTRVNLVAITVLAWTVGVTGAGLSQSFLMLFIARLLLGSMEAGAPPAVSLLSDWYSVSERAKIMGLFQGGALIGGLVGLIGGGVAVGIAGWRAPFFALVPLGLLVGWWVRSLPEPDRGSRDAEAGRDLRAAEAGHLPGSTTSATTTMLSSHELTGVDALAAASIDAETDDDPATTASTVANPVGMRDAITALRTIPTFWLGLVAIGVAQLLLTALQFWGVEYFKRVHGLSPAKAGLIAALLGAGAAAGVLGGGPLANWMTQRGVRASRVYVVAIGAIGGTLTLMPAFASNRLLVTTPLFVLGGLFLTLPIAPAEALLADVVGADLRGRAGSLRSIVRGASQTGPLLVGLLSASVGLQRALVLFTPVYAAGGILVLFAVRTYDTDHRRVLLASGLPPPPPRDTSP